jgi:hypothetical protein
MLFYPANLAVWYPYESNLSVLQLAGAVAFLAVITGVAVWQIGRRPYIAVGWFWFVGTLVPVIGLVQVGSQSLADRYTYVPYFGLFIIIVFGAAEPRTGALVSTIRGHEIPGLNHRFDVTSGVLEADCRDLIQQFFRAKR